MCRGNELFWFFSTHVIYVDLYEPDIFLTCFSVSSPKHIGGACLFTLKCTKDMYVLKVIFSNFLFPSALSVCEASQKRPL